MEIRSCVDRYGKINISCTENYIDSYLFQLSLCQLGAAISVSIQTKHANLISSVLGTDLSLITIGVSLTASKNNSPDLNTSFLFFGRYGVQARLPVM